MAPWEAGGDYSSPAPTLPLDNTPGRPHEQYVVGGKRRVSCGEGYGYSQGWIQHHKRPKYVDTTGFIASPARSLTPESVPPARGATFFVRRCEPSPAPPSAHLDPDWEKVGSYDPGPEAEESEPASDYATEHGLPNAPSPVGGVAPAPAPAMERTASGLSISSGITHTTSSPTRDQEDPGLLGDLEAAQNVREHLAAFVRRSRKNSRHERILRALINPKTREASFPMDDAALSSVFSAANAIFFASRLSNRVTWDWSHESAPQYRDSVIGTTALRRCKGLSGFETLIVLSWPILMSKNFSRRLLISTFLHELIHCYLFVSCGFKAKESGGHTEGFRQIAALIDDWAGPEHLRLQDMEADLESYREEQESSLERHVYLHSQYPCELTQGEASIPFPDSGGRFSGLPRQSDDAHVTILRDQPHRLLRSRSQSSLRRRLYDDLKPLQYAHHQHPHTHRETQSHHHRADEPWEGWIDDRWHGDLAPEKSSASLSVPILVRGSSDETVPIRASFDPGVGAGGMYAEYNV